MFINIYLRKVADITAKYAICCQVSYYKVHYTFTYKFKRRGNKFFEDRAIKINKIHFKVVKKKNYQ